MPALEEPRAGLFAAEGQIGMDSEFCCECGAVLWPFESVLCTDCLHDAWYNADNELLDEEWFWEMDMHDENQAIVREPAAEPPTQDGSSGAALPMSSVANSEPGAK